MRAYPSGTSLVSTQRYTEVIWHILTPTINKKGIALLASDSLRILHSLPGKLRESFPGNHITTLLLSEAVLLAVGCIPNPIDKDVRDVQQEQSEFIPAIGVGMVIGEIDGTVAVAQGHTGEVPEDEHETPLLVVHIPVNHASVSKYFFFLFKIRRRSQETKLTKWERYTPRPLHRHWRTSNEPVAEGRPHR